MTAVILATAILAPLFAVLLGVLLYRDIRAARSRRPVVTYGDHWRRL